jgi:hypothetical protein
MPRYRFVGQPDHQAVTLALYAHRGAACGDVLGPQTAALGIAFPRNGALSATEALDRALKLARLLDLPLVVTGERALWNPDWGDLA